MLRVTKLLVFALLLAPLSAQDVVWGIPGPSFGAWWSVGLSPDISGDGVPDVLGGGVLTGGVYSGVDGSLVRPIPGAISSLVSLGDLDGDGRAEYAMGAHATSIPITVYSGFDGSTLWTVTNAAPYPRLIALDDIDGDGRKELAIGWDEFGGGCISVYSGFQILTGASQALWTQCSSFTDGRFGTSLASVADANGDGVSDVLVGAPGEEGPNGLFWFRGQVHLLSGVDGSNLWTRRSFLDPAVEWGAAVAGIPDLNGDGIGEMLVGAPRRDDSGNDSGAVLVLNGSNSFILHTIPGAAAGDQFGASLATLGDVDGDGQVEIAVGAHGSNAGDGGVHILGAPDWAEEGYLTGTGFLGFHPTFAGGIDATGDGLPDMVLASPQVGTLQAGSLALYSFGCGGETSSYCIGAPNSHSSTGGQLYATGSLSVVGGTSPLLQASDCATKQPGIFFYGATQFQQAFGNGYLCITGNVVRLPTILVTDAAGSAQLPLDFDAPPLDSGPGMISAGDTRYFQFWYRDPAAGGAGFNLTRGLRVTFCP